MKSSYGKIFILPLFLSILLMQCGGGEDPSQEKIIPTDTLTAAQIDSIARADTLAKYDSLYPKINYKKIKIKNYKHLLEILGEYKKTKENPEGRKVLITLNRQETRFLRIGEEIVLPDTIVNDMRAYSLFPQFYWGARDIPKLLMVSNKMQCYGGYEYGRLVRFAATNTGKERTPTFPGRYALVWKKEKHRSSLDSNWVMPYTWNFHAQAGNAFHQFSMPGRPVSHSCCRQFMDDARWLFYWGRGRKLDSNRKPIPMSGTPVILIDIFDFSRRAGGPWLDLKSNKDLALELPEKPMEVEEALIPYCQIPDGAKGSLRNRKRFIHAEDTLRARGIIRPHVKLIHTFNYNDHRRKQAALEAKKKEEEEKKKAEEEREERLRKYLGGDTTGSSSGRKFPDVKEPSENSEIPDEEKSSGSQTDSSGALIPPDSY